MPLRARKGFNNILSPIRSVGSKSSTGPWADA